MFDDGATSLALKPHRGSEAGVGNGQIGIGLDWGAVELQRHVVTHLRIVERAGDEEIAFFCEVTLADGLVELDVYVVGRSQDTGIGIGLSEEFGSARVANHGLLGSGGRVFLAARAASAAEHAHALGHHYIGAVEVRQSQAIVDVGLVSAEQRLHLGGVPLGEVALVGEPLVGRNPPAVAGKAILEPHAL